MQICNRCTRSFSSKRDLNNHINNRQNLCSRPTHYCKSCDKGLSSTKSLWRHKQNCRGMPKEVQTYQDLPSRLLSTKPLNQDHDSASVLSIGTLNRIVNNDIPTVQDVEEVIRGDNSNRSKKKRTRSDNFASLKESPKQSRRQPDIVDCVGYITPIKGSYDDDESQVSSDDADNESRINTSQKKILPLTPSVIADLFPTKESKDNGKKTEFDR